MILSTQVTDLIIAIIVVEFVLVSIWLTHKKQKSLIPVFACFLASGGLIILALRAMIVETPNQILTLGLLAASFPIHVATLVFAWRVLKRR